MNLESSLNQSIDTVQTLTETNSQLTNMLDSEIGYNKKYMELINHCGKIYEYLNKKNDKTCEETESLKILYHLITGSD